MPVVEAPREPEQAAVERVSQVELDRERLLASDEASADHHHAAQEPEDDDRRDDQLEELLVVVGERVVDRVARQEREGEPGGLRPDREHHRKDDRRAVRPKESEQPDEGRAEFGLVLARTNLPTSSLACAFRAAVPAEWSRWRRRSGCGSSGRGEAAKGGAASRRPSAGRRGRRRPWAWIALAVLIAVSPPSPSSRAAWGGRCAEAAGDGGGELTYADETAQMLRGVPQDGVAIGDPDAPVTLVEFADLQCPFCAQWATEAFPAYVDEYIRDGESPASSLTFIGEDSTAPRGSRSPPGTRTSSGTSSSSCTGTRERELRLGLDDLAALGRSVPGLDVDQWLADTDAVATGDRRRPGRGAAAEDQLDAVVPDREDRRAARARGRDVARAGGPRGPIEQLLGQ